MLPYSLIRPFIHLLEAERAHGLAMTALKTGVAGRVKAVESKRLESTCFGLHFPNPLGLAAGFDKNAEAMNGLQHQGFGFIEVGTVTPLAQEGNRAPRIFRLPEDKAIINRLGFNNDGLDVFTKNLAKRNVQGGIVGANLGKNKDSPEALVDYANGLAAVASLVDYVTINVSSPNTVGLRDLQHKAALTRLLIGLMDVREELLAEGVKPFPMLLKIAPDIDEDTKQDIANTALATGIHGLIISNTTIKRPKTLQNLRRSEAGGLSGQPLFDASTELLKEMYRLTEGQIPLIGVGGVSSGKQAYAKIRAGASLVQLYSALTYQGFGLVRRINLNLVNRLRQDGFANVSDAVGVDATS